MKRMAMLVAAMTASYAMAQQVEISLPDPATVKLDWQAIPGQTYRVMTTTNLVDHSWQDAVAGGLVAGSVIGAYTEPLPARAAFFRVQKEDTNPPEIESLIPVADAIAVQSNATVSITVTDETGIDTNSILLTVAGWHDMTLASPYVTYDNGAVVFAPPDALGQAGATITNYLTVADTLGHTLSNHTWTFQLARPNDSTDDFLPLTAPPEPQGSAMPLALKHTPLIVRTLENVRPLDAEDEYHIMSVTSNTVVFTYTGQPPAMPTGRKLVSFDAANPFYRQTVSNTVDTVGLTITVWTTDLDLTDLLANGSATSADFESAELIQGQPALASGDMNLLSVSFDDNLTGKTFYDDNGVTLHLLSGAWSFVGSVDIAWDVVSGDLRSLDAKASGSLSVNLAPEALFTGPVGPIEGTTRLISPKRKVFGGMAGYVPIWVEVVLELNAGYSFDANVSGSARTAMSASKELSYTVRYRDGDWSQVPSVGTLQKTCDPIVWQLSGEASAVFYVQPVLTVYAYSLAGFWADIAPYCEVAGWYQQNPLEYERGVYFGLDTTLGIACRLPGVPTPDWTFTLIDKRALWYERYPTASSAPAFLNPFPNRTVSQGAAVTLSGAACGSPDPTYRWLFNGDEIKWETRPQYAIASAQPGHQGTYTVEARNSAGTATQACNVLVTPTSAPYRMAIYGETAGFMPDNHDEFVVDYRLDGWQGSTFDSNVHRFTDPSIDVICIGGDNTFSTTTATAIEQAVRDQGKILLINFWSNRSFGDSLPGINQGSALEGTTMTVVDPFSPIFNGLPTIFNRQHGTDFNRESITPKAGATVLIRYADDSPALLYWRYGNGWVVQWASEMMGGFFVGSQLDTINHRLLQTLVN